MSETTTILVLQSRLAEARHELDKLAKKARRYGNPDITVVTGDKVTKEIEKEGWNGKPYKVRVEFRELHICGDAPAVGNYEFLARVEFLHAGNLVDTRPDVTDLDPRFRTSDGFCEHCNTQRSRKEAFVVRDRDTGAQVQVGRSCLRDYMGIDNPATVAARFNFYRASRELGESESYSTVDYEPIESLLALAAVCVRLFGWCSLGQANESDGRITPTASYVALAIGSKQYLKGASLDLYNQINDGINEDDYETAKKALAWVRATTESSDYMHNLRVICADDILTDVRRRGLVISAISAYHRAEEKELRLTNERKAGTASKHQGEIKERLRQVAVIQTESRFISSGQWGDTILIKFRDEAGNLYSWFTGQGTGLQIGERAIIDGTVKEHREYNGVAETQLSRVTIKGDS